jgi:hypothetical protein
MMGTGEYARVALLPLGGRSVMKEEDREFSSALLFLVPELLLYSTGILLRVSANRLLMHLLARMELADFFLRK